MKNGKECSIVQDLLPNYIEHLTSEDSNNFIEEHLKGCQECTRVYRQMTKPIINDNNKKESEEFHGYMNKTKLRYFLQGILLAAGIIGSGVSFLVDAVINRRFTWSLIVFASIFFVYAIGITVLKSKKYRIITGLISFSALILPLLAIIEGVSLEYGYQKWFFPYGIGFSIVWLASVWIGIAGWYISKHNVWIGVGTFFICSIPASLATNYIVAGNEPVPILVSEIVFYFVIAIACFYMAIKKKK